MKTLTLLFTAVIAMLATSEAFALPVARMARDLKLVTQQMIEKQSISVPVAASTARVKAGAGNPGDVGSGAVTITSFDAQPDVPRSISITPFGTTADVAAGNVSVTGTDFHDNVITEEIPITANQSSTSFGNYAFKTVTSIRFPAEDSPYGATWSVGVGTKLGLKRCMDGAGHFLHATFNNAYESTRPTVAAHATSVSNNTIILNSALNGSNVEAFFMQNYRCFP